MPSFEWGRMPQPNLGEYTRRLNHYNLIYSLPYYFAGLVLTLVGCGVTPAIVGRFRAWSSHAFRSAIATTLALAILLVIASDVGTLYGVWSGPLFLLHRYHDFSSVWALCQALLPAPILSGVIAVAKRWLATGQRHISG